MEEIFENGCGREGEPVEEGKIPQFSMKEARGDFGKAGLAYGLLILVSTVMQVVMIVIGNRLTLSRSLVVILPFLMLVLPMYLFGLPSLWAVLKKIPSHIPEKRSWSLSKLLAAFNICISVMYIGNIIGLALMYAVSGVSGKYIASPTQNLVHGHNYLLNLVAIVLIAPVGEELIFRKLLIDRIGKYGQRVAVLASAFLFGLSHGNFYQFFYAFGLGLIFAYIYSDSGKIRYPIIFHVIINFMGSVLSVFVVNAGGTVLVVYVFALLILVALGCYWLSHFCRQFQWNQGELEIPKGKLGEAVFLNPGMIFFIVVCAGEFILSLLS